MYKWKRLKYRCDLDFLIQACVKEIEDTGTLTYKCIRNFISGIENDPKQSQRYHEAMIRMLKRFKIIEKLYCKKNKNYYSVNKSYKNSSLEKYTLKKREIRIRELNILKAIKNCEEKNEQWTQRLLSQKTHIKKSLIKNAIGKFKKLNILTEDMTKFKNYKNTPFKNKRQLILVEDYENLINYWYG